MSAPIPALPSPNEEIDLADSERELLPPRGEPVTFTMAQVLDWRAERYRNLKSDPREAYDEALPLVMRRELYRGLDENAYRHVDFWALYFVRQGRGTHVINGHAWSMARGNIYLLSPESVHFYRGASDVVLDAVYFGEALFSREEQHALAELSGAAPLVATAMEDEDEAKGATNGTHLGHFLHLSPQRQLETEATLAQIRDDLSRPQRAFHLSAKSRLWCLMVQLTLWRDEMPTSTRGGESRELADVLHFCETHFSRPITVEQLAASTHFSRNHFTRLFTQEVGMAPARYLRHLRLQHAQKLLRETPHAVADIAQLCGFSDPTGFSRTFQKAFDVSPLAYRKSNKRALKRQANSKSPQPRKIIKSS